MLTRRCICPEVGAWLQSLCASMRTLANQIEVPRTLMIIRESYRLCCCCHDILPTPPVENWPHDICCPFPHALKQSPPHAPLRTPRNRPASSVSRKKAKPLKPWCPSVDCSHTNSF